jgi:hypothetical protein
MFPKKIVLEVYEKKYLPINPLHPLEFYEPLVAYLDSIKVP